MSLYGSLMAALQYKNSSAEEVRFLKEQKENLKKENAMLAAKMHNAREAEKYLSEQVYKLEEKVEKLTKDLEAAKTTIREQTSADILYNSLQAVGVIPTEKKIDHTQKYQQLLARQQANAMGFYSGQTFSPYEKGVFRGWTNGVFGI